jgi:hypothetical protein
MFASDDWCEKVQGFFSQRGLQEIAIDPRFDVLVVNPDDRPVIVQGVGVEIVFATQVTISLGDWETTRIPVDATYEIAMPPFPTDWSANELVRDALQEGRPNLPFTAGYLCSLMSIIGDECQWTLPLFAQAIVRDPIYLDGHAPYRFEVVLRDYHRLPNNVVLRFVVETNRGSAFSDYYYLLAM